MAAPLHRPGRIDIPATAPRRCQYVFAHEPLPQDSPLWALDNVIATPHSAGFSDGNASRVAGLFLDNLRRWDRGERLHGLAAAPRPG